MVIGDKVKLVNHPFYNERYARIIDMDDNYGRYKVKVDIDGQEIWVWCEQVNPAEEGEENVKPFFNNLEDFTVSSGYYDDHYRKMKVQPIILAQDLLSPEELIGAMKFNIIKYSLRAGVKDGEPAEKDEAKKNRYREWLHTLYNGRRIEV